MFFVFQREKIMAYIISLSTVVLLFTFSITLPEKEKKETIEVSSNEITAENTMFLNET